MKVPVEILTEHFLKYHNIKYRCDLYSRLLVAARFKSKVANKLYKVIYPVVRKLELDDEIIRNGHHITQKIVEYASQLILDRKVER